MSATRWRVIPTPYAFAPRLTGATLALPMMAHREPSPRTISVFGVVNGAQWDFYWATYGSTEYDRPGYAPKGWFEHKHFNPTGSSNPRYKIMGSGQIQRGSPSDQRA
jgi:hypothetical protein